jgi:hypothetical protein
MHYDLHAVNPNALTHHAQEQRLVLDTYMETTGSCARLDAVQTASMFWFPGISFLVIFHLLGCRLDGFRLTGACV